MLLMLILKINKSLFLSRMSTIVDFIYTICHFNIYLLNRKHIIAQMIIVGPQSIGILVITASFIGIVFTLQIVKEFLFLNASNFIGAILALAFIRELSPILTAVILTGRISSSFTAELATMKVTEQIDALFLLRVNPFVYLVLPRLIACLFMLPCLNIIFFYTSLCSSIIVCSIFYNIHPWTFLYSFFTAVSYVDFIKSSMKALVFSLIISIISCLWGLTTNGGSKKVGLVTTSSVVTSLLLVFIVDCILTYIIFNQTSSLIKSL